MIAAADNPLVAGGATGGVPRTIHIRVVRPFLMRTTRVEIDAVIEVDRRLGAELITANKAVRVSPPTAGKPAADAAAKAEAATQKSPAAAAKKEP